MSVAVHHELSGPAGAPPLLLSSSLGATAAMWEPQVPALAERLRVVAYDHRGHGGSPVPPAPYDIADLAGDALALMDRLGIERASWAGLSLGGMVGMWLAAHTPERIHRLVLLCTSAHMPGPTWRERAAAVRAAGTTDVIADAVVARWITPALARRRPDLLGWLRAMVAATPAEGYAACCGAIERMDLRGELAAIRAPTLVIGGEDDPSAPPPEHAEVIAAGVPGARVRVLPRAAHLANVEQPDVVTALILDHVTAKEAA